MRLIVWIRALPIGPPRRNGTSRGGSGTPGLSDGLDRFRGFRDRGVGGGFCLSLGIVRSRSGGDLEDGGLREYLFGKAAQVGAGEEGLAAPMYPGQQMLAARVVQIAHHIVEQEYGRLAHILL